MGDPYTIQLKLGAKPKALYTARKVPLQLKDAVEAELKDAVEAELKNGIQWDHI